MRRLGFGSLFFVMAAALTGCGHGSSHSGMPADGAAESASVAGGELELPAVPDSLRSPEERAAFVSEHFWDALDFGNDPRACDTAFMEQSFVNFLSVLEVTPPEGVERSVGRLLDAASARSESDELLWHVAMRYLDDPNSPMRNEELLVFFLRDVAADSSVSEERRERAEYRLSQAMKNRRGSKAADVDIRMDDGRRSTLLKELGEGMTMVMFYDPECTQCHEVIEALRGVRLREDVKILAVDVTDSQWEKSGMPEEWSVARVTEDPEERGAYDFPAMPSLYLLDPSGTVILKDAPPAALLRMVALQQ